MTLTPATYTLTVYQGATFRRPFTWTSNGDPVDLTGCTAKMQGRVKRTDPGEPLFEVSTEDGNIVITPLAGKVEVTIPAEMSSTWTWKKCEYQLELYWPNGDVDRLLQGLLLNNQEVVK